MHLFLNDKGILVFLLSRNYEEVMNGGKYRVMTSKKLRGIG